MKLFHFPRACSRVTMTALETAGFEYEDQVINIMKGEQKSPEYLAVHRSGKVPALQVDGNVITENASIIYYLHNKAPQAGLLPDVASDMEEAQQLSDLVWCSGYRASHHASGSYADSIYRWGSQRCSGERPRTACWYRAARE